MTDYLYEFVPMVSRNVYCEFASMSVSLFASSGPYLGFFVRNRQTNELMLPVQPGGHCAVRASNDGVIMAAFPARLGTADGEWLNVFAECAVTDPAYMPSHGGMATAAPDKGVNFDGLRFTSGQRMPFSVNEDAGISYGGRSYGYLEVAYRFPEDPGLIYSELSVLAHGDFSADTSNVIRHATYKPEAYSFGMIRLVSRVDMAYHLAYDGLGTLDPRSDEQWSISCLRSMRAESRITTLNAGNVYING